jgi:hypothetical protein
MMTINLNRSISILILALLIIILVFLSIPPQVGYGEQGLLQPTPFLTPTPRGDGRIIYIVQEGDTAWRIAAVAGITIEELMSRNGLQADDYISPGMELELGLAGPSVSTSEPVADAAPTEELPTATPIVGLGEICVAMFLDENGDGSRDELEGMLADGRISIADVNGIVAGEYTTDLNVENEDGYCFEDLENGDYNVSAAVPPDHNPTTVMSLPVRLNPGEIKYVQFGAQPSSAFQELLGGGGGGRSSVLGLLGVIVLAAGGGLGYYATRLRRGTPRSFR